MKDHLYEQRYKFPKDLTGLIFNKWTVLSDAGKNHVGKSSWLCRCVCGNEYIVPRKALTMGTSRSCIRKCASISFEDRLLKYVEKTESCWLWKGVKNEDGYGLLYYKKILKNISTHRASWIIHNGEIPEGLCVLHKCDNPSCVNPKHLFLGTNQDNCNDKMLKKRHKSSIGKTWTLKKPRKARCLTK